MTPASLDRDLLLFFNTGMVNVFFDRAMPFLSARGYLLVLPFVLFLFVAAVVPRDSRKRIPLGTAIAALAIASLAAVLADNIDYLLKDLIARTRPCRSVEGIRLLIPCPRSYSMPSGHAVTSFAFATSLYSLSRQIHWIIRTYPLLLAGLIAFSRVYLGVHYPSDMIAGSVLGALIGLIMCWCYEVVRRKVSAGRKK